MAIADTVEITHMPFGERPDYGSPYPEGLAVVGREITGDATGGAISLTINAEPGFLYRMEVCHVVRGVATAILGNIITSHNWAASRSGQSAVALDINWILGHLDETTFATMSPQLGDRLSVYDAIPSMRRFPMGSLQTLPFTQTLASFNINANTDTITHEFVFLCTYWNKQSTFLPGFLSSFYESPAVPPLIRPR